MRNRFVAFFAALCAMAGAAMGQPGDDDAVPVDQRRRLVEQKIRLLESLTGSPAAQGSAYGREAQTPALLLSAKLLVEQARAALAADQFAVAGTTLDDALRKINQASARVATRSDSFGVSAQKAIFANLGEQLAAYRTLLENVARQSPGETRPVIDAIAALQSEANQLAKSGQMGESNRKLAEANKLVVEAFPKLGVGQAAVATPKFDSPAQKYEFEARRFLNGEIFVNMMIDDGRAAGELRKTVDGFIGEGKKLHAQAVEQARGRDYKSAAATMETATAQFGRALQVMGLPMF